jgi:hypothetical protein
MRFKTGLLVGGLLGYLAGRELAKRSATTEERSPVVRAAMERHPSTGFAKLANRASWKSVEAIQRARASIQKRLVADTDDLSMN